MSDPDRARSARAGFRTNLTPDRANGPKRPLAETDGELVHFSVVLSLGSNLGDRLGHLRAAVAALRATPGLTVTAISGVYETTPVGYVEQPDFLNIVVLGESELAPDELLARTQAIEAALGRVRTIRPRTIDIDLVAVDEIVADADRLTLPHPRAHGRAFVLVPWLEIDPDAELVGHGRVADLVARTDVAGVRRITDWDGPT